MPNRNVDKSREAENAVARVLADAGMRQAERRTKRGGTVEVPCLCVAPLAEDCQMCDGTGRRAVPADAGDLTGIPGVVVQVKWSPYKPLAHDLQRTDEQRRVAHADIGLLVRKRKGVGIPRADEWDAYLPADQLAQLYGAARQQVHRIRATNPRASWHTNLWTAAQALALGGYGDTPDAAPHVDLHTLTS